MKKKVLAAASYETQKYFLEPDFSSLPEGIQEEIRTICIVLAQKLCCTFLIGFYENGAIYFDVVKPENCFDFDDIGAELEIKSLEKEKAELIKSLKLWYLVYYTEEGEALKKELLKNKENDTFC